LSAAPASVDLGAGGRAATVRVSATGTASLTWSASPLPSGWTVTPSSGTVQGGDSTTVTVSFDRTGRAEGDVDATLTLTSPSGSARIPVSASVEHPPAIARVAAVPAAVQAVSAACRGQQSVLRVAVTDESRISGTVTWSADGTRAVTGQAAPLPGGLSATVGPFRRVGAATVTVTVTDARGNRSTRSATLTVLPCAT
jgi:hypothetical protein